MGELAAHFFKRTAAVLAGIRADGATFITFPKSQGLQWCG
jgi:methylaspartate ammonia-lyase